jgi:hypothetical protein
MILPPAYASFYRHHQEINFCIFFYSEALQRTTRTVKYSTIHGFNRQYTVGWENTGIESGTGGQHSDALPMRIRNIASYCMLEVFSPNQGTVRKFQL